MAATPALSTASADLGMSPSSAPVGSGLARQGIDILQARKLYNQHVLDAQENGKTPLQFDEFLKLQQQQLSPAAASLGIGG